MLSSIVLDLLLVIVVLLMIPLGFLRGGLKELCTSAGLLLGILLAERWTPRIGDDVASAFNTDVGQGSFLTAMAIVILLTALVGYGSSAAFSYRPGPGGRMYGAFLAAVNGLIVIGFLISAYITYLKGGQVPPAITDGWVSRALSQGFEWVLLVATLGVMALTVFGMFVRERGEEEGFSYSQTDDEFYHIRHEERRPETRPMRDDEPAVEPIRAPQKPVRIKEVRHWEEDVEERPARQDFGTGWRQTWPGESTAPREVRSRQGTPPKSTPAARRTSSSEKDVLRDFISSEREDS